jgi:excisionase family DNA binding protein
MTGRRLLTVAEVSEITGFSTKTIYRWALLSMIPAKRIGRSVRFDRAEIDRWIAKDSKRRAS